MWRLGPGRGRMRERSKSTLIATGGGDRASAPAMMKGVVTQAAQGRKIHVNKKMYGRRFNGVRRQWGGDSRIKNKKGDKGRNIREKRTKEGGRGEEYKGKWC